MNSKDLIKKVRKIEIKSRGLSAELFSGEYHSAFKGRGMSFSEVREYQPGDDIRIIDWNVTARLNHPYVKVFEEERELTLMLLVDMSASKQFGSVQQYKQDLVTELCAVLAFSSLQNNDKVGVIFFSDRVEKFIPPKKGKSHVLRIIRELIEFSPAYKLTQINAGLYFLNNVLKKKATVFLISDFLDNTSFEQTLKIAARKHDLMALKIQDPRESEWPNIGLVYATDVETGQKILLDTSDRSMRRSFKAEAERHSQMLRNLFAKHGIDYALLRTDRSYVSPLVNLFKRRRK